MDRPVTTTAEIIVTRDGPVTTFLLNRPERLNALTFEMHHALQEALDAFAADDGQRIGVIAGAGDAFCSGSDLKAIAERRARGEGKIDLPRCGYAGLVQRFDLDKPLIAAVNGVAAGGGFEIALACDLIVASETARFGLPEPRAGFVAVGGGPHRLVREIGLKRTMDLVLTGRLIDAAEARSLGFVNEVVPVASLPDAVARWADAMLKGGPMALRASKALVHRSIDAPSLAAAIGDQDAIPAMRRWRASGETSEGPRAFAAKRPAAWMRP
ncbi:enoyl-CoA hydratase/isomerase family protein [Rhizorhabdus wittichii]|uniref:Enoyl-CoA hydratase/isomerase family protein n=1 Tax=Rhizorhabdus wittichii TaxID=160791 RepID=A0A975D3V5_9SPHN|nr:enoyl-CoA hydratase-related protein [Rhizorhabdus wittichii]QTH21190.1 enoyl-CoA hydratase/isomerase family protein [Rhizorhabdus wittichii]